MMLKKISQPVVMVVLLAFPMLTVADELGLQVAIDSLGIDSQVAADGDIGETMLGITSSVSYKKSYIRGDLGFGIYLPKDHDPLTQNVVDGFGNRDTASANATGLGLFAEVGPSYAINPKLDVDLMLGMEAIWLSREISNCLDCNSESIDMPFSTYVSPRLHYYFVNKTGGDYGASLSYVHAMDGSGIESGLRLAFTGRMDVAALF